MSDFSKQHTNLIKGVAALLLLFHHLFYQMKYFDGCFVWSETWIKGLHFIASNAKVCVALFLFLSGYGLVKSANRFSKTVSFKFSALHIIKILLPLWFVYILFVPLGYVFGITFADVYGTGIRSVFYVFTDLTGMSHLLGFYPKANATWWFFGEIIRLYVFFPLFYYSIKKNSALTFVAGILLSFRHSLCWFLPFILGMIFSEKDLLSAVMKQRGYKKICCAFVNLCLIVLFTIVRQKFGITFDGLYAAAIVCFLLCLLSPQQIVGRGLVFIGRHSANIFMFHTFIYSKYLNGFIYGFKYPLLIFLVLTLLCLIISVLIEKLKKLVRFEKLGELMCNLTEWFFGKINIITEKINNSLNLKTE